MREGTLKQLNVKVGDKVRPIRTKQGEILKGVLLVLTHVDHVYGYCKARQPDKETAPWEVSYDSTIFRLEEEALEIKVGDEVLYDDDLGTILCKVLAAQNHWAVINYQGGRPWVVDKTELKPKPVVKEVVLYGQLEGSMWAFDSFYQEAMKDTHKITFNLVDGEPDCNSIRMEKL